MGNEEMGDPCLSSITGKTWLMGVSGVLESKAGDLFRLPPSCEEFACWHHLFPNFLKGTLQGAMHITSET